MLGGQQRYQAKDDLESAVGWGYEGYGAKARDGNGPIEVYCRCGIMGRMSDPHKRGNNGR